MAHATSKDEFFAALAKRLNELVLVSDRLTFDAFVAQSQSIEKEFSEMAEGRPLLLLELLRRLEERRIDYWLDRPGNDSALLESVLDRCALGFESAWHEGCVLLGALRYLLKGPTAEKANTLLRYVTALLSAERERKASPGVNDLLAICEELARDSR